MTDDQPTQPLTFEEFFKQKHGMTELGIPGELLQVTFARITKTVPEYIDYRIDLAIERLNDDR